MLWPDVVESASLFEALEEIDAKIAAKVQAEGCPVCGSRMHVARFPRRPRGRPRTRRSTPITEDTVA